jgi:hypothetical protein
MCLHWYNPKTKTMENAPTPSFDAQAVEMLSGHPDSDEFIEEYRKRREVYGIAEALELTGDTFRMTHQEENPPEQKLGGYRIPRT